MTVTEIHRDRRRENHVKSAESDSVINANEEEVDVGKVMPWQNLKNKKTGLAFASEASGAYDVNLSVSCLSFLFIDQSSRNERLATERHVFLFPSQSGARKVSAKNEVIVRNSQINRYTSRTLYFIRFMSIY